ncbi:endothelin-converting enzyme 1-like [Ornithodoros turicata]|uniref:endothelin-converting enzyme 1-like n=1 Tax=Ornithodoros turicata TaxID=34597 RepID=UPI003138B230
MGERWMIQSAFDSNPAFPDSAGMLNEEASLIRTMNSSAYLQQEEVPEVKDESGENLCLIVAICLFVATTTTFLIAIWLMNESRGGPPDGDTVPHPPLYTVTLPKISPSRDRYEVEPTDYDYDPHIRTGTTPISVSRTWPSPPITTPSPPTTPRQIAPTTQTTPTTTPQTTQTTPTTSTTTPQTTPTTITPTTSTTTPQTTPTMPTTTPQTTPTTRTTPTTITPTTSTTTPQTTPTTPPETTQTTTPQTTPPKTTPTTTPATRPTTPTTQRTPATHSTDATTDADGNIICGTEDCKYMRWLIDMSVDANKNPCDNFYTYVCSGSFHTFTYDDDGDFTFTQIYKNITASVREDMKKASVPTSGQSAYQKAVAFYRHCKAADKTTTLLGIRTFLMHLGMDITKPMAFDPLDVWVRFLVGIDIPLIYGMYLQDLFNGTIFLTFYKQRTFLNRLKNVTDNRDEIKTILTEIFSTNINASLVESVVDAEKRVIEEYRAAPGNLSVTEAYQKNRTKWGGIVYLETLLGRENDYDLGKRLRDSVLNHTESEVGRVLLYDVPADIYIRDILCFNNFFGKHKTIAESDLRLYFTWRTVSYLHNITREFYGPDRKCFYYTRRLLRVASLSKLMHSVVNTARLDIVNAIVDACMAEVSQSFGSSALLTNQFERTSAQEKLSNMRKYIGFQPKFDTLEKTNEYYRTLPDLSGPFIMDYLRVQEYRNALRFRLFGTNRSEYVRELELKPLPMDDINAGNVRQINTIKVAPGAMLRPFITEGGPPEVNFGAFGRVITHEVMHGYDLIGRRYDQHVNRRNIFSSATMKNINAQIACYNASIEHVPTARRYSEYPNEYLADVMGTMSVFRAYQKAVQTSKVSLGRVKSLTREQIYFVSWCLLWCGKDYKPDRVAPDHPPLHERCNVPLMNDDNFSKAFSCKPNDPMNPPQKCPFW